MRYLAEQPLLARSYERLDVDQLTGPSPSKTLRAEIKRAASGPAGGPATGRCRGSPSSATGRADRRGAAADHPDHRAEAEQLAAALDDYLARCAALAPGRWAATRLVDIAHKVVGVGSVGLRAYVALLEGSSPDDVLFLQLKQARRSVLAPYVHGDSAWHAHQGQRVVEYQQALQTVSDPLLGWTTVGEPPVLRPPVPRT